MDSLKRVLLHPSSPPVCPAPAPPLPSTTPSTSSLIVFASPMARPAPFTGSAEECNGFLLQCTLTIDLHPQMFPTDQSKIAFLITSLTGPALQWAETILNQAGPATQTFSHFLAHFREVFGSSPGDSSVGEQLFQLRQGTMPIHQYSLKFRTLAAASGWNEPSLLTAFRQGLNSHLRLHLAAYDDTYGLEKFIQLAIRCSNRLQSCSVESSVAIATPPIPPPEISDPPEPIQTDYNRLSSTERRRRLTEGLCLYCGASGHRFLECPLRPPRALVSTIRPPITKMNPLSTCAQLTAGDFVVSVTTLLDSGSAGNFIAGDLCRQLRLPTSITETAYEIQSITGKPLTRRHVRHSVGPLQLQIGQLHQEELHLLVLEGSTVDIILGRPWLVQHDPHLSWKTGEVLKWGNSCFPHCFPRLPRPLTTVPVQLPIHSTSVESPVEKQSVNVPSSYSHFSDVFCPKRAAQLPPHRPWDCAIDLFPGEPVPHGKIYPLSLPEQKAMEEYIEEALKQGYIVPSTSPAASSFFFVAKKDGSLRPCIDYRKLNEITANSGTLLPLFQQPWNNYAEPPYSLSWTSAALITSSASVKGMNGRRLL